ncbi:MAG: hypothetical protein ABI628_11515 [Chloroflexota bacterium]
MTWVVSLPTGKPEGVDRAVGQHAVVRNPGESDIERAHPDRYHEDRFVRPLPAWPQAGERVADLGEDIVPGQSPGLRERAEFAEMGALLPGVAYQLVDPENDVIGELLALAPDRDRGDAFCQPCALYDRCGRCRGRHDDVGATDRRFRIRADANGNAMALCDLARKGRCRRRIDVVRPDLGERHDTLNRSDAEPRLRPRADLSKAARVGTRIVPHGQGGDRAGPQIRDVDAVHQRQR